MTLTPKEAIRLAHAAGLGKKHGREVEHESGDRGPELELSVESLADLIDEANAVKDATIARLRAELQQAYCDLAGTFTIKPLDADLHHGDGGY